MQSCITGTSLKMDNERNRMDNFSITPSEESFHLYNFQIVLSGYAIISNLQALPFLAIND